jgi:hypothetical protein
LAILACFLMTFGTFIQGIDAYLKAGGFLSSD